MIYLCDNLLGKDDEGFLKVNKKLANLLKDKKHKIVQINGDNNYIADVTLGSNGLLISKKAKQALKNKRVLYSCEGPSAKKALKLLSIKLFSKPKELYVLFVQINKLSFFSKLFLKMANPKVILLSEYSKRFFNNMNVHTIKCGVDITKFTPLTADRNELRLKYNIPNDKKVLLHVGHMKAGRNVEIYSQIKDYTKILITSSSTEADPEIKNKVLANNTIVFDTYIPKIEELYQLADCYVFPVDNFENCIDIPLSVLEACATGIPVVAYNFKDLEIFNNESFILIDKVSLENIDQALKKINFDKGYLNRKIAEDYDWNKCIDSLIDYIEKG